jgi:hypothetical protein
MKNVFILLMLILCSLIRVSAQKPVAEWTFHATYQENAIELDSVYIENVTENCHTTIYAPVTSFSVNYSGVDDLAGFIPIPREMRRSWSYMLRKRVK